MKVISPFGPKIAKLKFPPKLIKKINSEVDKIISQKKLIKKFDYSKKLVGQVKQELQLSRSFVKKNLEKKISDEVKKFINKSSGKNIKSIKIKNFWVVRQFKNEYNPIHYHNGQLSGVGYLKIPKNMNQNKVIKNKKVKTNGTIDFINGQKNFLSKSIYNLNPKIGDLLIFPNYLMHAAYPFNVDGERRSFSFNAKITFKK